MDFRLFCFWIFLCIFDTLIVGIIAEVNDTDPDQPTTTQSPSSGDTDSEKVFENPFWLVFTVIFFIALVIVSVSIALVVGIYKFRKEAKKRGHYRHKCKVYREPDQSKATNYEMFRVPNDSPREEVNAAYVGSTE